MGMQLLSPAQDNPPRLAFSLGSDKVHVAILKNDAFLQKGKIIESVMNLTSLRNSVNQLYLAAPRLLGTAIDAEVFRSQGIGLLLFDDRRIDETVAPRTFCQSQPQHVAEKPDLALVSEVRALQSMYLEIERTVSMLRADLKSFRDELTCAPSIPERISQPQIFHQEPRFSAGSAELPSFFNNNPWLDVLSRRGREEVAPIAG
jgi:hypothetical protein